MSRHRAAALIATLLIVGLALVPSGAAAAGEPIMPLAEVQPGMRCTGASVIRGVEISTFDVEVLDVVGAGSSALILVRVSGPAVDATGIAQGFSGSPVRCPDAAGTPRNIGAIALGTGDYGGFVVYVTPIETMLAQPVDVPAAAAARTVPEGARPLATPLTFGGVSGPVAAALRTASAKTGRALYAAPAAPRAAYPPQVLQPGSSVAVGLATGDVSAGAVGTVTYVDGTTVWAFGHPFDGAGRRSLLLQDAWVHTVIGNPLDLADLTGSYKLASPGHSLGTLTNDAPPAVVGRLGALPDTFPLNVSATDLDSGKVLHYGVQIADETAVGQPTGVSSLTQVAPVAVAQAAYDALGGSPVRQSGEMCARIQLRERSRPLRFCNTYVGGSPTAVAAPMVADLAAATTMVDSYNFKVLHVTSVSVNLKLRRELRQAYLLTATGPSKARRGQTIRVRVAAQRVRGAKFNRTIRVRVPADAPRGDAELTLTGTPADAAATGDSQDLASTFTLTLGDDGSGDDPGPTSVEGLADTVAAIARTDGVTASFRAADDVEGESATADVEVLDDPELRISGQVAVPLTIRR